MNRVPHKMNVPGDFYVEDGCCTACDLPSTEAPGFFEYEETESEYRPGNTVSHCFFCKQPQSKTEIKLVLNAMEIQELDCIRYKGNNEIVLKLMDQNGLNEYSDFHETRLATSGEYDRNNEKPKTLLGKVFRWFD